MTLPHLAGRRLGLGAAAAGPAAGEEGPAAPSWLGAGWEAGQWRKGGWEVKGGNGGVRSWRAGAAAAPIEGIAWRDVTEMAVPEERRSAYGPEPVFYLRDKHGACIVVKACASCEAELCAAEVAAAAGLGITVPRTRVVPVGTEEYGEIFGALSRLSIQQVQWHGQRVLDARQAPFLAVCAWESGHGMVGMKPDEAAKAVLGGAGAVLKLFGELTALDLLLNTLRFPLLQPAEDAPARGGEAKLDLEGILVCDGIPACSLVGDGQGCPRLCGCEFRTNVDAMIVWDGSGQLRDRIREMEKLCKAIAKSAAEQTPGSDTPMAPLVAVLRQEIGVASLAGRAVHLLSEGFAAAARRLSELEAADFSRAVRAAGAALGREGASPGEGSQSDEDDGSELDEEWMAAVSAVYRRCFGESAE